MATQTPYRLATNNTQLNSGFAIGGIPVFQASNGALYKAYPDTYFTFQFVINKSTDGGKTWTDVSGPDGIGAGAVDFSGSFTNALGTSPPSFWSDASCARIGDKIYAAYNDATNGQTILYGVFDTASDTWTTIDGATGLSGLTPTSSYAGMVLGSDPTTGDLHLLYSTDEVVAALHCVRQNYATRTSGAWGAGQLIGGQAGSAASFLGQTIIMGQTGIAHLIAYQWTAGNPAISMVHSSVVAGTAGAWQSVCADVDDQTIAGSGPTCGVVSGRGVAFTESSTNKIAFPYLGNRGADPLFFHTMPDNRIAIGDDSAAPTWTTEQADSTTQSPCMKSGLTEDIMQLIVVGGLLKCYWLAVSDPHVPSSPGAFSGMTTLLVSATRTAPGTWGAPTFIAMFGSPGNANSYIANGFLANEDDSALCVLVNIGPVGSPNFFAYHLYVPLTSGPTSGCLYFAH